MTFLTKVLLILSLIHGTNLKWKYTVTPSIRFNVYRSQVQKSGYTRIGQVTKTSYTDTNVIAGGTYYYYVTSYDTTTGFESSNSNIVKAVIP